MDFYDDIAKNYAQLTGADQRRGPAGRFVRELIDRFEIRSALDAACGAGMFAIELARCGLEVVGSDISAGMLKSASVNAAAAGVDAGLCTWVRAPMQELGDRISTRPDAILCMGNSIPHLLTDEDLRRTVAGFASILGDRGVLAVHLLNYARVLDKAERIVGVTRDGPTQYVRFYDFGGDFITFNILEIQWGDGGRCEHKLHATTLRPYLHDELTDALGAGGFGRIEAFGGLGFEPFDPETSDTLCLTATI